MLASLLRPPRLRNAFRSFATASGSVLNSADSVSTSGPVGLLDDLSYRGYVQDVTDPRVLHEALETKPQVVYVGIDPTARSLHVGHLLPLMCLLHFHVRGHHIIPLIGGATGLIGDPSGRTTERELAETETTKSNTNILVKSVESFFKRALLYADDRIVLARDRMMDIRAKNNIAWHQPMSMMDFLRTVGIHSRINTMLNKESVRTRLHSNAGMSFTEFTYQLLQAYDFYHLHKHFGCSVQIGGSDQWGNILAGISLIDRIAAASADPASPTKNANAPRAFGLTTPLLTTSTGVKFGKTAGNAVWLDPTLTSVFNFYQYFVRTADAEVESYLKLFTLLSWTEINETMESHKLQPEQRIAQRRLASELTELVHTKSGRVNAETMTKIMFETELRDVTAADVLKAFDGDRSVHMVDKEELMTVPVVKLAVKYGLASSASAARVLVLSRGLYFNNKPVPEVQFTLRQMHLLNDELVILKAGKDKLAVLVVKES
ncbi:Tyrosine--tRNA ligase [Mycena sanguinolenta]|uniref:Tyrosine--tRNA ligase n=1 Tax=Mycena sanguinolenta TaxID=230812 RepID=A0A8H6ZC18_9AGAR|nr:Tyrosine--tRNA ligase [Mycena sanguinolenta]